MAIVSHIEPLDGVRVPTDLWVEAASEKSSYCWDMPMGWVT